MIFRLCTISILACVFLFPNQTHAVNYSIAPQDQRITEATVNAVIEGKPVVLKNTYKYGVPKDALENLGYRKMRVMVFEDPQGKPYFTTYTGNPNDAADRFRPFQQLYIDGKRVFRLMSDYGPKNEGNNNEFVHFGADDPNFGVSYSPEVDPAATKPVVNDGEIKPINLNIEGSDPNKPNITVTDPSTGEILAKNTPDLPSKKTDECTFSEKNLFYCMLAPVRIFADNQGRVSIEAGGFNTFLNNLVRFALAIATGLATIMIVIGGVQYASTDAIGGKSEGAARIKQALTGLFLALVSYAILNTINPDVFSTDLRLEDAEVREIFTLAELLELEKGDALHENEHGGELTASTTLEEFIPTAASEAAFPGIGAYKGKSFGVRDNSNNPGTILPQVAYLRDFVPTRWRYLLPVSTYRSAEHNKKIGGSPTSDHLRGAAIDFAARNKKISSPEFINDGYSLVEFLKQNGSAIGVDQIIFRDLNWRLQGEKWVRGGKVGGHMDHVHVGFQ